MSRCDWLDGLRAALGLVSRQRGRRGRRRPANARRNAFEVLEDRCLLAVDFGDAPDPFPTLLADDGARHEAVGPILGTVRDAEADGLPTATADGDDNNGLDDEDGVVFSTIRAGQADASAMVYVSNAPGGAKLDAWVDFNGDGNWDAEGERILASADVSEGENVPTFAVPSDARIGETFARFRLSTDGGLRPTGESIDGEVEDLVVSVGPPTVSAGEFSGPWLVAPAYRPNTSDLISADVDGDGDVDLVANTLTNSPAIWIENVDGELTNEHTLPPELYVRSVGDIDSDGDLDLVGAAGNTSTRHLHWYENIGPDNYVGHLVGSSTEAYSPGVMTTADLDGDGDVDVIASRDDDTYWFENDGHQQFTRHLVDYGPVYSSRVAAILAADMDRDGDLDIVASSTCISDRRMSWFENNGSESFSERVITYSSSPTESQIFSIAATDVDLDGDLDVVAAARTDDRFAWYENNGAGTFVAHSILPASSASIASFVTVGDLDGDGDSDIATTGDGIKWYANDGLGQFQERLIADRSAGTITTADFDNDGDLDVAAVLAAAYSGGEAVAWFENVSTSVAVTATPVTVYEDSGDGITYTFCRDDLTTSELVVEFEVTGAAEYGVDYTQFGATSFSATAGTITFPAGVDTVELTVTPIADAELESSETVIVTLLPSGDYVPKDSVIAIGTLIDEESADFGDAPANYATTLLDDGARHAPVGPRLGSLRDEEPNGQPDPAAGGDDNNGLDDEDGVVFGALRVGQSKAQVTVDVQEADAGAYLDAWIDFDGDGYWGGPSEKIAHQMPVQNGANVIVFGVPTDAVSGTTYARFRVSSVGGLKPIGAAADGEVEDYAVQIEPPRATTKAFLRPQQVDPIPAAPWTGDVASGDLDSDGDVDLVAYAWEWYWPPHAGTDHLLLWYENDGGGSFTRHFIDSDVETEKFVLADMDGDTHLDIFATVNDDVRIYHGDGAGGFALTIVADLECEGDLFAADLDADGDIDLVHGEGYAPSGLLVWVENRGHDEFVPRVIAYGIGEVDAIDAADLDADGDLDLVSAGGYGGLGVFWYENDGLGGYTCHTLSASSADGVCITDADGDGDPDIFVGDRYDTNWFENDGTGSFQEHAISEYSSYRLYPADMDGDGDSDLVAADFGVVWLYVNDGQGHYSQKLVDGNEQLPDTELACTVADLDGDGALDMVVGDVLLWYQGLAPAPLLGDYNLDDHVDAADYCVWRDTLGTTNVPVYWGADGSGNGEIDEEDYVVWKANFGATLPPEVPLAPPSIDVISKAAWPIDSAGGNSGESIAVSENGRYVAFTSDALNLANGWQTAPSWPQNIYRYDRLTGEVVLVSVNATGDGAANGSCFGPVISADGRVVLFYSSATNLHPLDSDEEYSLFARDLATGTTHLVNVNAAGTGAVAVDPRWCGMSADGNSVVFVSTSNDLHPLDTNSLADVFVRHLDSSVTELVSVNMAGSASGNGDSYNAIISANGNVVVFESQASDLHPLGVVPELYNTDIYARDLTTGITHLVTVDSTGTTAISDTFDFVSVSADGSVVAFETPANGLDPLDQNGHYDVFARNMLTGITEWVSLDFDGGMYPQLSADGDVVVYRGPSAMFAYDLTAHANSLVPGTDGINYHDSYWSVSADGSVVAFATRANNLHPLDTDMYYDVYVSNFATGQLDLVSVNALGTGNGSRESMLARVSADGSFVAFTSLSDDLVEGDENTFQDVFTYDVASGETELVSAAGAGLESVSANEWSYIEDGQFSANGRYVVFTSYAENLVSDVAIPYGENVYRYDRLTGEVVLVSVNLVGDGGGNGRSYYPRISADGNIVAFVSKATNLHALDTDTKPGIFARDLTTNTTYLVSVNAAGTGGVTVREAPPSISADGNRIAFTSSSNALHPLDTDAGNDIFVRDLATNTTHLVTVNAAGTASANGQSGSPSLSADGNLVAFWSEATDLHALDNSTKEDIFVRDLAAGVTQLVSVNTAGTGPGDDDSGGPVISADGNVVAFLSCARNLHELDNDVESDVFARDLTTGTTHLVSVNFLGTGSGSGASGDYDGFELSISADGRVVAFHSEATDLHPLDYHRNMDVYAYDLATGTMHWASQATANGYGGMYDANCYNPTISGDGSVVVYSASVDDVEGLNAFAYNLLTGATQLINVNTEHAPSLGDTEEGFYPVVSFDGRAVAFQSYASDLVESDYNGCMDVFLATLSWGQPDLPGDYNQNGTVDAADYTVWRDALGTTGLPAYSGADGSGNGEVDEADYAVWKANFGKTLPAGSGPIVTATSAGQQPTVSEVISSSALSTEQPIVEDQVVSEIQAEENLHPLPADFWQEASNSRATPTNTRPRPWDEQVYSPIPRQDTLLLAFEELSAQTNNRLRDGEPRRRVDEQPDFRPLEPLLDAVDQVFHGLATGRHRFGKMADIV